MLKKINAKKRAIEKADFIGRELRNKYSGESAAF